MTKGSITNRAMMIVCLAVMASAAYYLVSHGRASESKHGTHPIAEGSDINLSDDLKRLLNEEMRQIEEGMMDIIPAISAGNWEAITSIAMNIESSFILKQKLTQEQLEALHHSLPTDFIAMDQSFHSTAGKLAHAASQQDGELINFYFYRLHSQCMACHSEYASERFPGFQERQRGRNDHH